MEIVYNDDELKHYMSSAVKASAEHPVLVDHYLQGTEVEVDPICDGKEVLIPGIMEHVERAGVHSGDSIAEMCIRDRICSMNPVPVHVLPLNWQVNTLVLM